MKIRIIVAIDRKGAWQAHGSSDDETDGKLRKHVFVDHLENGERYCFIEAEIPDYQEPTIQGEIKGA